MLEPASLQTCCDRVLFNLTVPPAGLTRPPSPFLFRAEQKCDDIFSEAKHSSSAVIPRSLSSAQVHDPPGVEMHPVALDIEVAVPGRISLGGESQASLGYVAGVISRARLVPFERVLFRATRGNMYLRHAEIAQQASRPARRPRPRPRPTRPAPPRPASAPSPHALRPPPQVRDPASGELVYKSVFLVFFSGSRVHEKVAKICTSFHANRQDDDTSRP